MYKVKSTVVDFEMLRADGFREGEIGWIEEHCDMAMENGKFNHDVALVLVNGQPRLCCETIAEIIELLRPGSWLPRYRA
jgi:hypothetical protein